VTTEDNVDATGHQIRYAAAQVADIKDPCERARAFVAFLAGALQRIQQHSLAQDVWMVVEPGTSANETVDEVKRLPHAAAPALHQVG
jgi:hypothetical protein